METTSIPLSTLRSGDHATLDRTEPADTAWLHALGLSGARPFFVRREGDPVVVDIGATSIGLSAPLARTILVRAVPAP